ncbi:MAG: hypothetical protein PVF17_11490 [Ignavibacteria bacterium]|jgi:BirA family biotin operon repressor/biotin-[acetyl-CoA-carboxylase] ligase
MQIFSDSIDSINTFTGNRTGLIIRNRSIPADLLSLTDSLYGSKEIFQFDLYDNIDWNYLFIVKEADRSQFDLLVELSSQLPDKVVCIAEEGTGFHGFRNRGWDARKGNIHISLFFKPQQNFPNFHAGVLIASAVSIIETIDLIPGLKNRASTKWVNDIIIDGSKVSGVITQTNSTGNSLTGATIGIGLNVFATPAILSDKFTPKAECLQHFVNFQNCKIDKILSDLLKSLAKNINKLNTKNYEKLYKKYCQRSAVIDKNVAVYSDKYTDTDQLTISGKVIKIGKNLELYFDGISEPIRSGRLAMLE